MHAPARGRRPTPLYFLHVPRTAGTTIAAYLESGFRPAEVCPAHLWHELLRFPRVELACYRLFCGHFGAMLLDLLPERPTVITMLRDPVDQLVSAWTYVRRHPSHPEHLRIRAREADFADFVAARVPNPQTRALAVDVAPTSLLRRCRSSSSAAPLEALNALERWTANQPDLLQRAIARLHECSTFGIVDRFDDSMALIAQCLGWASPTGSARLNARPASEPHYRPSPHEVALVRARNSLDCALLDRARAVFEQRNAALHESPHRPYEQAMAARSRPLQSPLVIDLREPFYGTGWLPPIDARFGHTRWMGPSGPASIDVPALVPPGSRLEFFCAAAATARIRDGWRLEIDGAEVSLHQQRWGSGLTFTGTVPRPNANSRRYSTLTITVPETIPIEVAGPLPDVMPLGLAFAWVRLIPPGVAPPPSPSPPDGPFHRIVVDGILTAGRAIRPARGAAGLLRLVDWSNTTKHGTRVAPLCLDVANLIDWRAFRACLAETTEEPYAVDPLKQRELHACLVQHSSEGLNTVFARAAELLDTHGQLILRGVPPSDLAMIAIMAAFGGTTAEGNEHDGQLVSELTPDVTMPDGSAVCSHQGRNFPLHTDTSWLAQPHDYVALLGVTPAAASKTRSLTLHVDRIVEHLPAPDIDALCQPAFPLPGRDSVQRVSILAPRPEGGYRIRYRNDVLEVGGAKGLDCRSAAALRNLGRILATASPAALAIDARELLVLDNRRVLHGRTTIDGLRLLKRVRARRWEALEPRRVQAKRAMALSTSALRAWAQSQTRSGRPGEPASDG